MSSKYGWIAAWTLEAARTRASEAPVMASAGARFTSSPAAVIRLRNQPTEKAAESSTLAFVGFGRPEHNGLIFEATNLRFESQDAANAWLDSTEGKTWCEGASGVNLIQVA